MSSQSIPNISPSQDSASPLQGYPAVGESFLPSHELTYHLLSAGNPKDPLIICLHGFPELAYSYRKVLAPIAASGYHVVAYDQRGYGQTTGWDTGDFNSVDLDSFQFTNIVRDVVILVKTLGYKDVACVIGNDFGGYIASLCALMRPDIFKSTVVMSHPFKGPPSIPTPSSPLPPREDIHRTLSALNPPRKHYKWYYASPPAAQDLLNPPDDLPLFIRRYFHLKSASWPSNYTRPLESWTASEMEKLPLYYIMPLQSNMREAVDQCISLPPSHGDTETSTEWLPESDLLVYANEFRRTGFQGGLNWYRVLTSETMMREMDLWADAKIEIPIVFISGTKDWGAFQEPGALIAMEKVCTKWKGKHFVDGAGHWVQQEQPEKVVDLILNFLQEINAETH